MVNTTKKGNKIQRYAKRYFEKLGYTVHMTVRTSQRRGGLWLSQSNDIFNAFDGIATKLNEKPVFFQTTAISNMSSKERIIDVPLDTNYVDIFIMGYKGGVPKLDRRTKEKTWLPRHYFKILGVGLVGGKRRWGLVSPQVDLKQAGVDVE